MKTTCLTGFSLAVVLAGCAPTDSTLAPSLRTTVYKPGNQKPVDSKLRVQVGDKAPGFTLPAVSGRKLSLSQFRGRKNVVVSFVPAAFTPVCSKQWPGYNISLEIFEQNDAVLLGVTTDNIPAMHAWTVSMGGLDFEVLSDFWPHGKVASSYGVLRSDGTTERALFVIDKQGVIRYIDVHDINKRPPLEDLAAALAKLELGNGTPASMAGTLRRQECR